jgi:4-alpha-glucanotransferase
MRTMRGRLLEPLATWCGVQTVYRDAFGRRQRASDDSVLALLRALGEPVARLGEVPAALRERQQAWWRRLAEPVIVAWDGQAATCELRLPAPWAARRLSVRLKEETGRVRRWEVPLTGLRTVGSARVGGRRYVRKRLSLPQAAPLGYHDLTLEVAGATQQALLICAPTRADGGGRGLSSRSWGVFAPLYALRSRRNFGVGDFGDLRALQRWVRGLGGGVVATLPLLAAFLDEPYEPSPYLPASRLCWNELYLDVARLPELCRCRAAQALLNRRAIQDELAALRRAELVDYRRVFRLKRRVLEPLAETFFAAAPASRRRAFERFLAAQPHIRDYAAFRALGERYRAGWRRWPAAARDGAIPEREVPNRALRYHLYAQWQAHEQLQALAGRDRARLYLDLPLGVHADGYDVWRYRPAFVLDACGGAPPDAVFTGGQNWGFPPLHPERLREQGYAYYRACLRHHLRAAGLLRIDHVMSLHRVFMIPSGCDTSAGAYVRYRAEELYAILSLESHRHRALLVGENLGTVPPEVAPAMARHGLHRLFVVEYELPANPVRVLGAIAPDTVASINTHDMPMFAAFWEGRDIATRLRLGLLPPAQAKRERVARTAMRREMVRWLRRQRALPAAGEAALGTVHVADVLRACLAVLGNSRAQVVLATLEDLWLEGEPQNIPGTGPERLNWSRTLRYTVEELRARPDVGLTLRATMRPRGQPVTPVGRRR